MSKSLGFVPSTRATVMVMPLVVDPVDCESLLVDPEAELVPLLPGCDEELDDEALWLPVVELEEFPL